MRNGDNEFRRVIKNWDDAVAAERRHSDAYGYVVILLLMLLALIQLPGDLTDYSSGAQSGLYAFVAMMDDWMGVALEPLLYGLAGWVAVWFVAAFTLRPGSEWHTTSLWCLGTFFAFFAIVQAAY